MENGPSLHAYVGYCKGLRSGFDGLFRDRMGHATKTAIVFDELLTIF
jgi:hypothetical protein